MNKPKIFCGYCARRLCLTFRIQELRTSLRIDLVKSDVVKVEHAGMGIG